MKVTLDRVWLHDADNFADFLAVQAEQPSVTRDRDGGVRKYASGRLRTITRVGTRHEISLSLFDLSDQDLAKLEGWLGRRLMYRDIRGRLLFASFFSLAPRDYPDGTGWRVDLTLHEVSGSVEV